MPKASYIPSKASDTREGGSARVLTKHEFGRKLFELMVKHDMNQSDLARRAGIGRDNVSKYVNGKQMPTPRIAAKLAQVFNMDVEELVPNFVSGAYEREPVSFEMKSVHGKAGKMWLRIDQEVTQDQAIRIAAILNEKLAND